MKRVRVPASNKYHWEEMVVGVKGNLVHFSTQNTSRPNVKPNRRGIMTITDSKARALARWILANTEE